MDLTNLLLDTFDMSIKMYSVICRKPYATVRVRYSPQKDRAGEVTEEAISFSVINGSSPEIEVQRAWFLTTYKRHVNSDFIDSKLPVKVRGRDRATYIVPMAELKEALNKRAGETIIEAVVLDKNGDKYTGRVGKAVQEEFAR